MQAFHIFYLTPTAADNMLTCPCNLNHTIDCRSKKAVMMKFFGELTIYVLSRKKKNITTFQLEIVFLTALKSVVP